MHQSIRMNCEYLHRYTHRYFNYYLNIIYILLNPFFFYFFIRINLFLQFYIFTGKRVNTIIKG